MKQRATYGPNRLQMGEGGDARQHAICNAGDRIVVQCTDAVSDVPLHAAVILTV